jgi:hypothetical protein
VFTIFSSISVQTDSGAIMSITNANANFGDYCMISKGYGPKEFSGTVYNPPKPPLYPNGEYPKNGNVQIFVPDINNRPHISLIMETIPPDTYRNAQDKLGFLTGTVTTNEIIEGSLTINNIETVNMYIGQNIYIKDQFGSYKDEVFRDEMYLEDGTTIVDLGPSTIYLSRPINRGRSEPDNPAFFTIFTCGNAYYTVLTSELSSYPPAEKIGEYVFPSTDQLSAELESVSLIKNIMLSVIKGESYSATQTRKSQEFRPAYAVSDTSSAYLRVNELIDLLYNIINNQNGEKSAYDIPDSPLINKKGTPTTEWNNAAILINLNADFIAEEVMEYLNDTHPTLVYNKVKCKRDAKLIANKIAEDMTLGGNYNTVYSGLSYYLRKGTYHIVSLNDNVRDSTLFPDGVTVNFYQRSYITASGYLFEYVGAGSNYGALPQVGKADPVQGREVNMLDGGKVFFTSTDQNGDFRIGPGLVINQAAGILTGRTFQKSLFAEMTPFILAIE